MERRGANAGKIVGASTARVSSHAHQRGSIKIGAQRDLQILSLHLYWAQNEEAGEGAENGV